MNISACTLRSRPFCGYIHCNSRPAIVGDRQRRVEGACFSLVSPTPVDNPAVVAVSEEALSLVDVSSPSEALTHAEFAEYFSGNKILPGSQTAAHCYCGHQFGHFSGQLGDGCAM